MKDGVHFIDPGGRKVYNRVKVAGYLLCEWAVSQHPPLASNPWIKQLLGEFFQDWVKWKVERTMESVDLQTSSIQELWKREENSRAVEKFQEIHPDSRVVLHDENSGAVFIEHSPNESRAQSLLGGAIEIRTVPHNN